MEEPQTVNVPNMHLQKDSDTQWLYSSAEYAQQQRGNRCSPRAAVQTNIKTGCYVEEAHSEPEKHLAQSWGEGVHHMETLGNFLEC